MAELTETLLERGIVAENMLLPGHGTQVRDMFTIGWSEWAAAVSTELQVLKQRCDSVFLIGHSLGGALCLHTAAHEEVTGVITMCAPLYMHPLLLPAIRLVKCITPVLPTIREDIRNPKARRRYTRVVYGWTAMASVESMLLSLPQLRKELPQVAAPVLIMTATHDHVVPARDGRAIYRRLGSQEKHLVNFHHSYHVIMVDHDREEVIAQTLKFIERHVQQKKAQENRRA